MRMKKCKKNRAMSNNGDKSTKHLADIIERQDDERNDAEENEKWSERKEIRNDNNSH